jgi:SulP family sulfate permease
VLRRLLPFLNWPRPNSALQRHEAMVGLTIGLVIIPQSVAYAVLAGMPLVTGIYAAMLPGLVAALFGHSVRLSVGPTAMTCLLVSASLSGVAEPASTDWVNLAVWLALISGAMQLLMGLIRSGWLLDLVNAPVLMAFSQAAALLIMASQLPALLGSQQTLPDLVHAPTIDFTALLFGLLSLVALLALRRHNPRFPGVLVIMLIAAVISYALGFEGQGGAVVGALPRGLPDLSWPTWPGWTVLRELLLPALVITLVSFLETAASAKVDNAQRGTIWNKDQDLIGQGLAKIASGLCGSFPTSGSFSRSALNLFIGARSGWSSVFSALVVLAALLLLLPILHHVPRAVLAAIVVVAVAGLVKPRSFMRVWRISRMEGLIAAATFGLTLAYAPQLYAGVLAGVLISLSYFLYQRMNPHIVEVSLHSDGRLHDRARWNLPSLAPHTLAFRMDAALDFGSAHAFERHINQGLQQHPQTRQVVIVAGHMNHIDSTGVDAFARVADSLRARGCHLWLVGCEPRIEAALRRAGAWPEEAAGEGLFEALPNEIGLRDKLQQP